MSKFRKKPVEIEATQFTGDLHPHVGRGSDIAGGFYTIGKQGRVAVNIGDWIIAELDGSGHYPCAPGIFAVTYEPVLD